MMHSSVPRKLIYSQVSIQEGCLKWDSFYFFLFFHSPTSVITLLFFHHSIFHS